MYFSPIYHINNIKLNKLKNIPCILISNKFLIKKNKKSNLRIF